MRIDQTYRVALFGHRDFGEHKMIEDQLYLLLKDMVRSNPFVEIYIGRNGEFDIFAATIVKRVQNAVGKDNNELICVLPYPERNMEYYGEYYDNVMIPECIGKACPKGSITRRNRWMVEQADLLVCYVERKNGGAYTALTYAKKLGKQIINLAELDDKKFI